MVFARIAGVLCVMLPTCTAQYTTYTTIWGVDNGNGTATVYAAGYTEDVPGHGVNHNMGVHITLWAPNGTQIGSYVNAENASVLVSLPAVEGTFQASTDHSADCAGGYFTTTADTVGLRLSSYSFCGVDAGGRCMWCPDGSGCPGTCGQSHLTNMIGGKCFTAPNNYKTCLDVVKSGHCFIYRLVCNSNPSPGSCT